jgi:hypothetical protein
MRGFGKTSRSIGLSAWTIYFERRLSEEAWRRSWRPHAVAMPPEAIFFDGWA